MCLETKAILLLDPSDESRSLNADALRGAGFTVVSVPDCDAAHDVLNTLTPQLMVATFDIHTREECLAFCERLNGDSRARAMPVLLTSALITPEDVRHATQLSVLTLALAPTDGAKLTSAVRGVLAAGEGQRTA